MPQFIGLDIGGTKISGVLIDSKGKILKRYSGRTEASGSRDRTISNITLAVESLKTPDVAGVGYACPGFATPNGKLRCIPNIPRFEGYNLKKELEHRTGIDTTLENDANCFAFAEQRLGAAKGCKNVVGVILGTGVGSGIIIDGRVYGGAVGGAGEIGNMKTLVNGAWVNFEDLVSGTALAKRYNLLSGGNVSGFEEANRKSVHYRKVYSEFVEYVGLMFANTMNTLNPECIVVGGGLSNLNFYKDVRKVVDEYAVPALAKSCVIRKHKLGDDSGVIGAAMLAMK